MLRRQEVGGEPLELLQILRCHHGAVAWNDRVDVLDVCDRLGERLRQRHAAAAVGPIAERRVFPGEHVAGVEHLEVREDAKRVAAGVAGAEVIEIDPLLAAAERQLVLVRLLGQELRVVAFEGVHLLHVGLRVLLRDDLDRRAEEAVVAGVIPVRVGVDDPRHRLGGDALHLVEDRLAPAGELRVHERDAAVGDEHGDVAAAERGGIPGSGAREDIQVVFELHDVDDARPLRLRRRRQGPRQIGPRRRGHRERADQQEHAKQNASFHVEPSRKEDSTLSARQSARPATVALETIPRWIEKLEARDCGVLL